MQTDYFVLQRAGPATYPLLQWDQPSMEFFRGGPVDIKQPVRLRLGAPVPPKPVMVDYHSLPRPVISTRLKEILELLELHRVQLVPADVQVSGEQLRYWYVHVHNQIACMDRRRSAFSLSRSGRVNDVERLVLDETSLGEIRLEERLAFQLAEYTPIHLFHGSVVEKVMALKPEGLRFIRVDLWTDAAAFQP